MLKDLCSDGGRHLRTRRAESDAPQVFRAGWDEAESLILPRFDAVLQLPGKGAWRVFLFPVSGAGTCT